jgi:hypothetical protein
MVEGLQVPSMAKDLRQGLYAYYIRQFARLAQASGALGDKPSGRSARAGPEFATLLICLAASAGLDLHRRQPTHRFGWLCAHAHSPMITGLHSRWGKIGT